MFFDSWLCPCWSHQLCTVARKSVFIIEAAYTASPASGWMYHQRKDVYDIKSVSEVQWTTIARIWIPAIQQSLRSNVKCYADRVPFTSGHHRYAWRRTSSAPYWKEQEPHFWYPHITKRSEGKIQWVNAKFLIFCFYLSHIQNKNGVFTGCWRIFFIFEQKIAIRLHFWNLIALLLMILSCYSIFGFPTDWQIVVKFLTSFHHKQGNFHCYHSS